MTDSDTVGTAWAAAQARLPEGWTLDGLLCASTGLGVDERSDDWIAVALGPRSEEREARAGDPIEALSALARSFESDDEAAR
jgi:hypothetical protein